VETKKVTSCRREIEISITFIETWNRKFLRVRAPQTLSLQNETMREDLIKFFADLRNLVLKARRGVIVDFSQTSQIFPAGGLMLLAELDRIKKLSQDPGLLKCKPAQSRSVADQVLNQIGVYECLGHRSTNVASDQTVVHWRCASGLRAQGEDAGSVLGDYQGDLTPALRTSLYRGITEAMTNAVQHAYLDVRNDGTKCIGEKRWWLFSEQRDGHLYVVFCDLGIGIPRSLPIVNSNLKKILSSFKPDRSDIDAIRLATKLGETSTQQVNRGKGLPEILDAARKSEQGKCLIYSNRGQFGFGVDGNVIENQFSSSIYGTLIEWRVPLSEGVVNDD
jgi:hypothetical protein